MRRCLIASPNYCHRERLACVERRKPLEDPHNSEEGIFMKKEQKIINNMVVSVV